MPPVRTTEISETRKCLDMKHVDGNNVQCLLSVEGKEKNNVVEQHVTYKSPWNMPHLCHEYDRDGKVSFKRLRADRYKKNLTFFGTYHIGTCITVLMESARTMKPFLADLTLIEEMEADIGRVDEVDERTAKVYNEFSSGQRTSKTLQRIMESGIQELVLGYRRETKEDHGKTENADEKRKKDDKDDTESQWCHDYPCVWSSDRNGMIEWDENEHRHLASKDIPSNSTRWKYLYRQMALTILERPLGKGNRIVLPDCVKDGICSLLPKDEEGKYMGHKDEVTCRIDYIVSFIIILTSNIVLP
jgi:hypothetical protein